MPLPGLQLATQARVPKDLATRMTATLPRDACKPLEEYVAMT